MESLLFPLLLAMLAGFMFLTMRKQKKRMNEMQEMQNSVTTGTRVQLTSGLFGTVIDADSEDTVDVEIATGVVTRWNRLAVMRVVPIEEAAATYVGHVQPAADYHPHEVEHDDFEEIGNDSDHGVDLNKGDSTDDPKRDSDK